MLATHGLQRLQPVATPLVHAKGRFEKWTAPWNSVGSPVRGNTFTMEFDAPWAPLETNEFDSHFYFFSLSLFQILILFNPFCTLQLSKRGISSGLQIHEHSWAASPLLGGINVRRHLSETGLQWVSKGFQCFEFANHLRSTPCPSSRCTSHPSSSPPKCPFAL